MLWHSMAQPFSLAGSGEPSGQLSPLPRLRHGTLGPSAQGGQGTGEVHHVFPHATSVLVGEGRAEAAVAPGWQAMGLSHVPEERAKTLQGVPGLDLCPATHRAISTTQSAV